MSEVEKIIEVIGISDKSWEEAGRNAISSMGDSAKEYKLAEVKESDIQLENGKMLFRLKLLISN